MDIQIENLQKKIILKPIPIKNLVQTVLKGEGIKSAALDLAFVTAQKIRSINSKYLNHHYVTDVITFDYGGPWSVVRGRSPKINTQKTDHRKQTTLNGEIIISTDAVRQNARKFKTSEAYELALYLVHGILHLLGYDDKTVKDKAVMREAEERVMGYLGKKIDKVNA